MTVNDWIENGIENGTLNPAQVVAIYDKNNNLAYLGKADFSPLTLFDEFVSAVFVGNELRINERSEQSEQDTETPDKPATILQETFKHGSIGLFCADNDSYYVSIFYYKRKNGKTVITTDYESYKGFNAFNRAFYAYERKREYMGKLKHVVK